jgi:hypothetical protein
VVAGGDVHDSLGRGEIEAPLEHRELGQRHTLRGLELLPAPIQHGPQGGTLVAGRPHLGEDPEPVRHAFEEDLR